jgi:hypothetical protein
VGRFADVLTKPLVSTRFQRLCFKLNIHSPPLTLREKINTHDLSPRDSHPIRESWDTHPIRNSNDKDIRDKHHKEIEIR